MTKYTFWLKPAVDGFIIEVRDFNDPDYIHDYVLANTIEDALKAIQETQKNDLPPEMN